VTFTQYEAVTISQIVGPDILNTTTIVRNPSGSSFELGIDTSDTSIYHPYVSGGLVTPLGNTGYFDFGVFTAHGISMEVKSYVLGQWVLALPFPVALAPGDAYTMIAGCDKQFDTCRTRFNNVVNFGGYPYVPGIDQIIQIGRH
jgi:Phage conserved hypothetical protein BR0599